MQDKDALKQGWAFASKILGVDVSAHSGNDYVTRVDEAIEQLTKDLVQLENQNKNAPVSSLAGNVAESWHADTFNIDAVASGSKSRARVLTEERGTKWSVDIELKNSNGDVTNYGSKYNKTAIDTIDNQSLLNVDTREPGYKGQKRLVPHNQIEDGKKYADNKIGIEETKGRQDVAEAYRDTRDNLVDRISDGKAESKPLDKSEAEQIARDLKEDKFNPEKYGVSAKNAIYFKYVIKQATKAGLTAAAISAIIQTAPEIFKAIDYLIKNKELDVERIKKIGTKAISATAEGFLIGSIACTLQIYCANGSFGSAIQGIAKGKMGSTFIGVLVSLTYSTINNSILVASGKMTSREMGNVLIDTVVISSGYVAGAYIGGVIGQAIGFELPVIGYLLGSLIGSSFAAVYNVGKKKLISFCVESGFTCFGLVEQDYTLPEEVLKDLGIDITPISRIEVSRISIDVNKTNLITNKTQFETIEVKVLRRGVLGVNKIGYVF